MPCGTSKIVRDASYRFKDCLFNVHYYALNGTYDNRYGNFDCRDMHLIDAMIINALILVREGHTHAQGNYWESLNL